MADHRFKNSNPLRAGNYWQRYFKPMAIPRKLPTSINDRLSKLYKALNIEVKDGDRGTNIRFK